MASVWGIHFTIGTISISSFIDEKRQERPYASRIRCRHVVALLRLLPP